MSVVGGWADVMVPWVQAGAPPVLGVLIGFGLTWAWRAAVRRRALAVAGGRPDWLAGRPDGLRAPVRAQVHRAADAALEGMVRGRHDLVVAALAGAERDLRLSGAAIAPTAMLRWCDRAIEAMGITGQHTDAIADGRLSIVLGFGMHRGGELVDERLDVDDVDDRSAWAGRLLVARAGGDRDTVLGLLDVVPGAAQLAGYAAATLLLVSATIRTGQRVDVDAAAADRLTP